MFKTCGFICTKRSLRNSNVLSQLSREKKVVQSVTWWKKNAENYDGQPQQGPYRVISLHKFREHFYQKISEDLHLHINTSSAFVNLKRSQNKELNHVPPNFLCCCNTRRNQSTDFVIQDFCLGCSKTETIKQKYVNIGTILVQQGTSQQI